jgi:hypothetical protein
VQWALTGLMEVSHLDDIINNGGFSLVDNFYDNYDMTHENNRESISSDGEFIRETTGSANRMTADLI